jgi:Uma2 family endonuclease
MTREGGNTMANAVETRYKPEDLLAMPDEGRFELIGGQLVERNMGAKSSYIASRLNRLLGLVVDPGRIGLLFQSDCGFQIFPDDPNRVRYADCSFIRSGRLPGDKPPDGHCHIAPDLVIEAVSPNDTAHELEAKVQEWLQAGVRLVWVAYPDTHTIHIFRADGSTARLRKEDELTGDEVLPGFKCRVADIFQGL